MIRCNLRGKIKREFSLKKDKQYKLDLASVGDIVDIDLNEDGTGSIKNVHERKNYISRKAPRIKGASYRGERLEQVIASNIDNLIIVSSVDMPLFNNRFVDRIIVAGESSHINPVVVINKIDLDENGFIEPWVELYQSIGYEVYLTSVINGDGIENIREHLSGKSNLFWGQSGVGKSSILNSLYPTLDLQIGEVSVSSAKGRHTTVTSRMIDVGDSTFVVDTPGIREIDPYGIKKEDLGHYYIEFAEYSNDCKFNTCTHNHEPGCAVVKAVEDDLISIERYESYMNLLDTIEDDMLF